MTDRRALAAIDRAGAHARLADIADPARDDAGAAAARSTPRGDRTDWPAFAAWCARHGLTALPAEPRSAALVVKRAAAAAGLDPARDGGRNPPAGLATRAAAADVPERVIAPRTGRASITVLRRCHRSGSPFRGSAAAPVGL